MPGILCLLHTSNPCSGTTPHLCNYKGFSLQLAPFGQSAEKPVFRDHGAISSVSAHAQHSWTANYLVHSIILHWVQHPPPMCNKTDYASSFSKSGDAVQILLCLSSKSFVGPQHSWVLLPRPLNQKQT